MCKKERKKGSGGGGGRGGEGGPQYLGQIRSGRKVERGIMSMKKVGDLPDDSPAGVSLSALSRLVRKSLSSSFKRERNQSVSRTPGGGAPRPGRKKKEVKSFFGVRR